MCLSLENDTDNTGVTKTVLAGFMNGVHRPLWQCKTLQQLANPAGVPSNSHFHVSKELPQAPADSLPSANMC